jgi:hypothetical protein
MAVLMCMKHLKRPEGIPAGQDIHFSSGFISRRFEGSGSDSPHPFNRLIPWPHSLSPPNGILTPVHGML